MADVNLRVNLGIDADTSQAKSEIVSLSQTLNSLASYNGTLNPAVDDKAMMQASKAAQELQTHLRAAVNVDTGKIDLGRFSASLRAAGQDLSYFKDSFMAAGEQGQQAFMGLGRQLANSEASVIRLNGKMAQFMNTMKNTVQWQAASMLIHGIVSSIQNAYKYAQDLNESLNNIRIVTGSSAEQMADFARDANSAAKALNTTTTDYTNASLIYFQQGKIFVL